MCTRIVLRRERRRSGQRSNVARRRRTVGLSAARLRTLHCADRLVERGVRTSRATGHHCDCVEVATLSLMSAWQARGGGYESHDGGTGSGTGFRGKDDVAGLWRGGRGCLGGWRWSVGDRERSESCDRRGDSGCLVSSSWDGPRASHGQIRAQARHHQAWRCLHFLFPCLLLHTAPARRALGETTSSAAQQNERAEQRQLESRARLCSRPCR